MEMHGKHSPIPHVLVAQNISKPSNFLEAKKLLSHASMSTPLIEKWIKALDDVYKINSVS